MKQPTLSRSPDDFTEIYRHLSRLDDKALAGFLVDEYRIALSKDRLFLDVDTHTGYAEGRQIWVHYVGGSRHPAASAAIAMEYTSVAWTFEGVSVLLRLSPQIPPEGATLKHAPIEALFPETPVKVLIFNSIFETEFSVKRGNE